MLIPCLHDEPEAYLGIFQSMFASVRGVWFLSEPEAQLAQRLYPGLAESTVTGTGVHVPGAYDPQRFRKKYGIDGRFLLYAGRREAGKNWDDLLQAFAAACSRSDLPFSLVTIGALPVHAPASIADRVDRPGIRPDGGSRRRVRRRGCLRAAVKVRELLAHAHGGVARRDRR